MLVQTEDGEGAVVSVRRQSEAFATIASGTDEEIRGVFARILQGAEVAPTRSAKILRVDRATYFRYLKASPPGTAAGRFEDAVRGVGCNH